MKARILVEVDKRLHAKAIARALTIPDVRVFAIVIGLLAPLPSDRARARVLRFVSDSLDERSKR